VKYYQLEAVGMRIQLIRYTSDIISILPMETTQLYVIYY